MEPIVKAHTYDTSPEHEEWDDSSIESSISEPIQEIHAVSVKTAKQQKPSDITCYKETKTTELWFDAHVKRNAQQATSKVARMCNISITIFFRKTKEVDNARRKQHRKDYLPVNKIATMLTFDPDTGFYNHLIRGKAYIVLDDGQTKVSKHTLWSVCELISEAKEKYHKYGADFSREGQMELMKACVQFKKGKWVPRSLYGMALTRTEPMG